MPFRFVQVVLRLVDLLIKLVQLLRHRLGLVLGLRQFSPFLLDLLVDPVKLGLFIIQLRSQGRPEGHE